MRVKLQLVICHDDGQEETVTDIITLNKPTVYLGVTSAGVRSYWHDSGQIEQRVAQ
jgi:hypothetical protein